MAMQSAAEWSVLDNAHLLLAGKIEQASRCDPHIHDTYTIAYLKRGSVAVQAGHDLCHWSEGELFFGNPYEVHRELARAGGDDSSIDYLVLYPGVELVFEALGISRPEAFVPQLTARTMKPWEVNELLDILTASVTAEAASSGSGAVEEALIRFFRKHPHVSSIAFLAREEITPVRDACRIMRDSLDLSISVSSLSEQVGISRSYFTRLFHKVTGMAPNAYYRQLKLSRARRLICQGYPLAEAAFESGFADQAHLTREFKRAFGSTPGLLARRVPQQAPAAPVHH